jgi:GT2 family glycosyltransferase
MDLAVIIVSWNTRDLTLDALRTLYEDLEDHGPDAQVWVVDSASSDGSAEAIRRNFPRVHLIASDTNLGFAGGNNCALREIGFSDQPNASIDPEQLPKAVYLLNPDTRTHKGATRALYDALFTLPHAGVVGARLSYGDDSFQHSAFRFPGLGQLVIDLFPVPGRFYNSALNGRYPLNTYQSSTPFPVDHTLGATMMLRREVIQQTGLFDEQYFMYCEEIDWSMRIRRAGWEIYCVPSAHVTHLGGQSTGQIRPQSLVNLWTSRMRLFKKNYSPLKLWLAQLIIRLGMQRQITITKKSTLSPADQKALIEAYRTVQRL